RASARTRCDDKGERCGKLKLKNPGERSAIPETRQKVSLCLTPKCIAITLPFSFLTYYHPPSRSPLKAILFFISAKKSNNPPYPKYYIRSFSQVMRNLSGDPMGDVIAAGYDDIQPAQSHQKNE